MRPLICSAALLLSGCVTLFPTTDQVVDESGSWSVIESDDATVAMAYAGKKSSRPVFLVSVTNHTDDTLMLEPQIIRYFASSAPFEAVQNAPDDWMELSARNSKLPMTMQFAVDSRALPIGKKRRATQASTWRAVLPGETLEETVYLNSESLYKYYRLVMPVSGNYYVFDFSRGSNGEVAAAITSAIIEAAFPW